MALADFAEGSRGHLIPETVFAVGWDETHIIALRHPRKASYGPIDKTRTEYYIVVVRNRKVYGPFDRDEYRMHRDFLGVADGLNFTYVSRIGVSCAAETSPGTGAPSRAGAGPSAADRPASASPAITSVPTWKKHASASDVLPGKWPNPPSALRHDSAHFAAFVQRRSAPRAGRRRAAGG